MRKLFLVVSILVLTAALAPSAWAADDGNTQPKLNTGNIWAPNDAVDIIATTSGTGNVKGVRCTVTSGATLKIYVNGGSAQSLDVFGTTVSGDTMWIPMNVRFTSSIRVRLENGGAYQTSGGQCWVSWALD
jgi:hypothetical protein